MPLIAKQLAELAEAMRTRPVAGKSGITVGSGNYGEVRVTELYDILIPELASRRARGEPFASIAADLNRRGVRGHNGARFYASSVRALLISSY